MSIKFQPLLLYLSKSHLPLSTTKQLHAFITKTHLSLDPFFATKLVRYYALNSELSSARNLFDKTPERSVFLWNSMIRAYARALEFGDAFKLYKRMLGTVTKPDNFTYACLVRACCEKFDVEKLRLFHGGVIVSDMGLDSVCSSALVSAYSKMGLVGEARKVFRGVVEPDLVMWNSMIFGYICHGFLCEGLRLFNAMREVGKQKSDGFTFVGLVSGLVDCGLLTIGQGIHGLSLKCGFECNDYVGSAFVSMYSRFRCMNSANEVFSQLRTPDLVACSALITGYSQSGVYERVLNLYRNLNMEGKKTDSVLIASVLGAASKSSSIWPGSEIHGYVLRHGFESSVMVSSALTDMYLKCGLVGYAISVFQSMPNKNIISYNTMISGLGLHGLASQAFEMFEEILEVGLRPDASTFSALLCACCHAGLIKDGQIFFQRMRIEFCIQAKTEHYIYIIKLLGMAGELEEAFKFILSLNQPIDSAVWGAFLSCCDALGNAELGEIAARHLFNSEPKRGAYKVMLSNIYAGTGRWDDVKKVRDDVTNMRMGKIPGVSWVPNTCKLPTAF